MKQKREIPYIVIYTVVFLLTFFISYSPFLIKKTTFIWLGDGRNQHYPWLVYLGKSVRQVIANLMAGRFEIPLFELSSSMGDDILGLLNAHGYTDPLMLVQALIPIRLSEYSFGFLAIFRMYLAGLSFSFLCAYFGKPDKYRLIGSIIYSFSGYALLCSMRHPYFINPMYLLPLLIVGADKILRKESPYLFIFSVFDSALCGYYHLYMMTIMVGFFVLVRFFDLQKKDRIREFIYAFVRGISCYCLGIGLASIPLFPAIAEFISGSRAGHSNFIPWHYSLSLFRTRIMRLVAPSASMGISYPTLAAIAFLTLVLLIFTQKRRTLKILIVIAFAFYMTDIGNFIMNGFQYPSERWSFGLVLVVSFAAVEMLPYLLYPSFRHEVICFVIVSLYSVCAFSVANGRKLTYVAVGVGMLALTLAVCLMDLHKQESTNTKWNVIWGGMKPYLCLLFVVFNVGVNAMYLYCADQGNYISGFEPFGYEVDRLLNLPERNLEPYFSDAPTGRADSTAISLNSAMVRKIPAIVTYSSVANHNLTEFFTRLENCGQTTPTYIPSSDQRTILNTLFSVKYHMESVEKISYVPYGYIRLDTTDSGNIIYENSYALPWGYTYEKAMSYEDMDSLNGLQKQEAMLQAVALDSIGESSQREISFDCFPVPYTAEYQNCSWEEDGILVTKTNNAVITLNYKMPANVEGYIRFYGLDPNGSGKSSVTVRVSDGRINKNAVSLSDLHGQYAGKTDFLINLGYCAQERTSLTITIPVKGRYKLHNIELYALPMDNYPERVEALRAEPLENIEMTANHVSGTVDLSKDKILCMSIPYSKGWTAKVDGVKTEILRGNYMFMCVPLTAGHHEIEFSYCSPGLKLGVIVSIISLCVVIGMAVHDRRGRLRA